MTINDAISKTSTITRAILERLRKKVMEFPIFHISTGEDGDSPPPRGIRRAITIAFSSS